MITPVQYVALASVMMLNAQKSRSYPADRAELGTEFETVYGWQANPEMLGKVIDQLKAWDAITVSEDKYAGETLRIFQTRLDTIVSQLKETGLRSAILSATYEGAGWFKKVFAHKDFWLDLHNDNEIHPASTVTDDDSNLVEIPASDRIVTLTDNQFTEIDTATDELVELLGEKNSIDGDMELKDRFVAQIKAARELVRAGSVRAYLLYETIATVLSNLIDKYAGTAIAETAKVLFTLYIESILTN